MDPSHLQFNRSTSLTIPAHSYSTSKPQNGSTGHNDNKLTEMQNMMCLSPSPSKLAQKSRQYYKTSDERRRITVEDFGSTKKKLCFDVEGSGSSSKDNTPVSKNWGNDDDKGGKGRQEKQSILKFR
jgi:hypothetical protein